MQKLNRQSAKCQPGIDSQCSLWLSPTTANPTYQEKKDPWPLISLTLYLIPTYLPTSQVISISTKKTPHKTHMKIYKGEICPWTALHVALWTFFYSFAIWTDIEPRILSLVFYSIFLSFYFFSLNSLHDIGILWLLRTGWSLFFGIWIWIVGLVGLAFAFNGWNFTREWSCFQLYFLDELMFSFRDGNFFRGDIIYIFYRVNIFIFDSIILFFLVMYFIAVWYV